VGSVFCGYVWVSNRLAAIVCLGFVQIPIRLANCRYFDSTELRY
jgi:hypothetical protein